MDKDRRLKPVLVGDFWMIGKSPDLSRVLQSPAGSTGQEPADPHQCVDHHIFQSTDGRWHLWGCIRGTAVGRILYHWEADALTDSPWQQTGEYLRVDHAAGESLEDWYGEEWIQSPYVVKADGTYFMFYGGHGTGINADGQPVPQDDRAMDCQICLMTSSDGRQWARHKNQAGQSRLFIGPGETRDPCVIRIDDQWVMYYAGYRDHKQEAPAIFARTSQDLLHWSDARVVHQDLSPAFGGGPWSAECPHVVFRQGYYYLFRTENYAQAKTHVFRSQDPFDFGVGNARAYYVGPVAAAAPEIIQDEAGREYITSNHDLVGGTQLCRLSWQNDDGNG